MKRINHIIMLLAGIVAMLTVTSCSRQDYSNSIPATATAVLDMNAMELTGKDSPFQSLLLPFVSEDSKELKGIDMTKDIYAFETPDGMLGVTAPVIDDYDLNDFLSRLKNLGAVKELKEIDDITYCVISGRWVLGFDESRILIMGPVMDSETEQEKMVHRMNGMLEQTEEESVKTTELWKRLQEMKAPVNLVAQASALPEQMVSACTIGTPKGTDPADVMLQAELKYEDGTLYMDGKTCSFNPNVQQSIEQAQKVYRPMTMEWEKMMKDTTFIGIFMNVIGDEYMPYLSANKSISTMLLGSSAYDKIKNNNGNIAILLTPKQGMGIVEGLDARVINMPKGEKESGEKLVVTLNLSSLSGTLADAVVPYMGKIKRIVYRMR